MENYNMVIAGVIGSAITLLLTAIFDYLKERYQAKIEIQKIIFQRKTDAAENAISWLQESMDDERTEEADKVSANIARILNENSFINRIP